MGGRVEVEAACHSEIKILQRPHRSNSIFAWKNENIPQNDEDPPAHVAVKVSDA